MYKTAKMEKCTTSEEEANFLRIFKLVTGVGTDVVRCKFDQLFPPPSLASNLQNHKQKLTQLNIERRLNMKQMTLLFPATGTPSSRNFDMTLMICLIRNLTCISPPINGFDKQPPGSETTIGADMARIKITRNRLAHADSNKISSSDFNVIWSDLTGACVRLGGQQYQMICNDMKSLELINGTQLTDFHCQLSVLREEFLEDIRELREVEIGGLQRQVRELVDGQNEILPQYKIVPTSVSVKATGTTTIEVKWDHPISLDKNVTGYRVFWREKSNNDCTKTHEDVEKDKTEHVLKNLSEWTKYSVWISAFTSTQILPSCERTVVRTHEGVPSKAPQNVKCTPSIHTNSIEITWTAPPARSVNGEIAGYKVYYHKISDETDENATRIEELGHTANRALLESLESSTTYKIWICVFTQTGCGPSCEPQVVKSCAVPPISNNSSNQNVFVSSRTFSLFNNIQQLNFSGNVNVSMVSETAMQNNMTDHSTTSSLPSSEPGQLPLNQGRSSTTCGALQSSDPKSSPLSQENTCGTEEDINHCNSMAKK